MAISEKQLVANKQNAKKGGVKTAEGKALTRLNALKHGLLSQEVLLTGENEETMAELEERLEAELQPQGELEKILVDRIVSSVWRLKRALMVERANMEYEHEDRVKESYFGPKGEQKKRLALVDMLSGDTTEKIMRYETAIERQVYKALHELIRLQMARQGEKPPAPVAIDLEVSQGD
jgi:CRISPR/Cas system-associated endonuclease Cas1